jgi:uncharacterized protein (DUF58 family)
MHHSAPVPIRQRFRLTRLGLHFLFVATFTMIGGALRGFNLLLVLSGLLIGALLVQWRASRWGIESSLVTRRLPVEAFAGSRFRVHYRVRNISRLLPVWTIRIDDRITALSGGEWSSAGCGVGVIGPAETVTTNYDCVVSKRGIYKFGPIQVSTSFPFSLFLARRIVGEDSRLHVFPRLLTLRKGWQQLLETKQGGAASVARRSGPHEGDFFGLREWQTGDNPRWIHHRTTARVGEPIVRQFEQQRRFDACLLVDCCDNGEGPDSDRCVETAISFAATLIAFSNGSPANQLVLAVADMGARVVAAGRHGGGKRQMLQLLAEATPTSAPRLVVAIERAILAAGHAKDLVVISPRSLHEVMEADDTDGRQLGRHLQTWVRRGGLRWINVAAGEVRDWIVDPLPTQPSGKPNIGPAAAASAGEVGDADAA